MIRRELARPWRCEIEKIKGSRFLAAVALTPDAAAARKFLDEIRAEHHDATHNCYAWRLGPEEVRFSDDGEPGGTAGRPILQEIEGRELFGVTVVVTRYYGGTRLGMGGLTRAYGGAAAAVLDDAGVLEVTVTEALHLTYDYDLTGAVLGVLGACDLTLLNGEYGAQVSGRLDIPIEDVDKVRRLLIDATADRIQLS